jgi:tRNA (cmo5U34)-methyltransferase
MPPRSDEVWKASELATAYLEGVRAAIPLAQEQIEVMLRLVAACEGPLHRFLDIGCGDGVLSAALLQRFPDAQGVLVDFSAPMLDAARKRFGEGAPTFVNADYGIASWTWAVASGAPYDAVVSGYSIHHQPDSRKQEIYREIFALLRSGGVFINIEHVSSASPWLASANAELFIDRLHLHQPDKSRGEVAQEYWNRPDKAANLLAPVETQCQWLRDIGFADVDCYLKIFELAVFGGRRP